MGIITFENISKTYKNTGKKDVEALKGINITFEEKGLYYISGPSGSGKTTIINLISGLINFNSGEIYINNKEASSYSEEEWIIYRRDELGYIFQDNNLFDDFSVYHNLMLPLEINGYLNETIINSLLENIDMNDIELDRKIYELSAGQKQRIAFARALIKKPKVILADEPTGNLDDQSSKLINDMLYELSKEILVIVVTHDTKVIRDYPAFNIQIENGHIIKTSKPVSRQLHYTISRYIDEKINSKHTIKTEEIENYIRNDPIDIKCKYVVETKSKEISLPYENKYGFKSVFRLMDESASCREKKIPESYLRDLAKIFFKQNFIKYFISAVILILSLSLLMFMTIIFIYPETEASEDYVEEYNIDRVLLDKTVYYTNLLNEEKSVSISKGNFLIDYIDEYSGSIDAYFVYEGHTLSKTVSDEGGVGDIFTINILYLYLYDNIDYVGRLPENEAEILVSDYLYNIFFEAENFESGKSILLNGEQVEITGLVMTGINPNETLFEQDYIQFAQNFYYNCVYTNFIPDTDSSISARDFYGDLNVNYRCDYDEHLILGSDIQSFNQIIVSSSYYEEHDLEVGDTVYFRDYYIDEYEQRYLGELNLYDIYNEELVISGVCESNEFYVVFSQELYNMIHEEYSNGFSMSHILLSDKSLENSMKYFSEKATLREPGLDYIDFIWREINDMKSVILPMYIVSAILSITSVLLISVSIMNKKNREIGILRVLGAKRREVSTIFIYQNLYLFSFCIIIATVNYILLVCYLNSIFSRGDFLIFKYNLSYALISVVIITSVSMLIVHLMCITLQRRTIFHNLYKE